MGCMPIVSAITLNPVRCFQGCSHRANCSLLDFRGPVWPSLNSVFLFFLCLVQSHETRTDVSSQRPKRVFVRDSFVKCSADREIVLNLTISYDDELEEHGTICFLSETFGDFLCHNHITDIGGRSGLVSSIRIQMWSPPSVLDLTDALVSESSTPLSSSRGSSSNILLLHICTLSALFLYD